MACCTACSTPPATHWRAHPVVLVWTNVWTLSTNVKISLVSPQAELGLIWNSTKIRYQIPTLQTKHISSRIYGSHKDTDVVQNFFVNPFLQYVQCWLHSTKSWPSLGLQHGLHHALEKFKKIGGRFRQNINSFSFSFSSWYSRDCSNIYSKRTLTRRTKIQGSGSCQRMKRNIVHGIWTGNWPL